MWCCAGFDNSIDGTLEQYKRVHEANAFSLLLDLSPSVEVPTCWMWRSGKLSEEHSASRSAAND